MISRVRPIGSSKYILNLPNPVAFPGRIDLCPEASGGLHPDSLATSNASILTMCPSPPRAFESGDLMYHGTVSPHGLQTHSHLPSRCSWCGLDRTGLSKPEKSLFHVHSHYTERERTLTSIKEPGAADERLVPFQGKNLCNLLRIFQVP